MFELFDFGLLEDVLLTEESDMLGISEISEPLDDIPDNWVPVEEGMIVPPSQLRLHRIDNYYSELAEWRQDKAEHEIAMLQGDYEAMREFYEYDDVPRYWVPEYIKNDGTVISGHWKASQYSAQPPIFTQSPREYTNGDWIWVGYEGSREFMNDYCYVELD